MPVNRYIEDGITRLRTRWPQSHAIRGKHGQHLIVVPSVLLAKGYNASICTVLFIAPAGFPAACPRHFFTDIEIRLANKSYPFCTTMNNASDIAYYWPQWTSIQRWHWKLQMWNPNTDGLFTFMNVIRQRLCWRAR